MMMTLNHIHGPKESGLLRLATALVGRLHVDDIVQTALAELHDGFPGTLWALYEHRSPRRWRARAGSLIDNFALSDFARRAIGVTDIDLPGLVAGVSLLWVEPQWHRHTTETADWVLAAWTLPGGEAPAAAEIQMATELLAQACTAACEVEVLRTASERDALTGLSNRRAVLDVLARETRRAERYGRPLSILFLDVDHFKTVNDTYGHAAGDAALCAIARVLEHVVRACDTVGRFGGDEFLVVLPETDQAGAERTARHIEQAMVVGTDTELSLSVSIGIAELSEQTDSADIIELADQRMLRCKTWHPMRRGA